MFDYGHITSTKIVQDAVVLEFSEGVKVHLRSSHQTVTFYGELRQARTIAELYRLRRLGHEANLGSYGSQEWIRVETGTEFVVTSEARVDGSNGWKVEETAPYGYEDAAIAAANS